jgi:hypothetical protein
MIYRGQALSFKIPSMRDLCSRERAKATLVLFKLTGSNAESEKVRYTIHQENVAKQQMGKGCSNDVIPQ